MLSYFPVPLPDEPLYSVYARYHDTLGYDRYSQTLLDLFGKKHISVSPEFPTHLKLVLHRLRWTKISSDEIIQKHTSMPYFGFLLDEKVFCKAVWVGSIDQSANVDAVLGLRTNSILAPEYFRCCPSCIRHDRDAYGLAYWHRVHQLPAVIVCPWHGQSLIETKLRRNRQKSRYELVSLESLLTVNEQILTCDYKKNSTVKEIGLDALCLLNEGPIFSIDIVKELLRSRLRMIGWASRSGRLRCEPIIEAWNIRYPVNLREALRCGICELDDPVPMLRRGLSKKHRRPHPLLVTMLVRTFGMSIADLIHQIKTVYGRASKVDQIPQFICCQNPICPAFDTAKYTDAYSYSECLDKPTVICKRCGAIYRISPDNQKITKILKRGYLWDGRLAALILNQGNSLRYIARTLHVDPMTVKRRAAALDIPTPWIRPVESKSFNDLDGFNKKNKMRKAWLRLCCDNTESGITLLRKMNSGLWTWLYRNDRLWLNENKPAPVNPSIKQDRKDWGMLDQQLTQRLGTCVDNILESKRKPSRITRIELARKLGITHLFRKDYIQKLPEFNEKVKAILDSRESFATRRIRWAARQMRVEGVQISRWKLIRIAGLRPDMVSACEQEISQQLESNYEECWLFSDERKEKK